MTRERGAGQTKAEGEPAWIKCTAALISSADCLNIPVKQQHVVRMFFLFHILKWYSVVYILSVYVNIIILYT